VLTAAVLATSGAAQVAAEVEVDRATVALAPAARSPSEQVIDVHRDRFGADYRIETEGPHPVERLRADAYARSR